MNNGEVNTDIANHVALAVSKKQIAFFSADQTQLCFEARVVGMDENSVYIENCVPPQLISQILASTGFQLQLEMIKFRSNTLVPCGTYFKMPMDSNMFVHETRASSRLIFGPSASVHAELDHPIDKSTVLKKSVLDLSENGMSIRTQQESPLFSPGRQFPKVRIYARRKLEREVSAEVVYFRKLMDRRQRLHTQVGFRFLNK